MKPRVTKTCEFTAHERRLLRDSIDAKLTLHGTLCPGEMSEDELDDLEEEKSLLKSLKRRLR